MKRTNASIPHWIETESRWRYQVSVNRIPKVFVSSKPGKAGYNDCLRKYNLFKMGEQESKDILFSEAWKNYLEDLVDRKGIDSNSYRCAVQVGRVNLLPVMKNKYVSEITDQNWQVLLNKVKPVDGKRTELSKKTIMNIRGEIMLFCKYAKKARLIDHKPEDLEIPAKAKYIGKEILQLSKLTDFLSDEDLKDEQRYIHAWQLMVVTGMRPGECYGLKESDLHDGIISIKRAISSKSKLTLGKNKNALRSFYQTDIAMMIIDRQRNKKRRLGIISPWLFPKTNGDMPHTGCAFKDWAAYRSEHDNKGVALYSMRHIFATYCDSKVDRKKLKCLLGHSESMNTDSYVHELDGDQLIAKEAVNEAFASILKQITK